MNSLPKNSVVPFLELSSFSPSEIGNRYRSTREKYPPYLHIFLPSGLLDNPIIAYNDGNYLVAHPYLMFNHSSEGLYKHCQKLENEVFAAEFGRSFELYTRKVLEELPIINGIWNESEIQKISPGRTCDYVIDLEDCVLLVECKATRYSSTLLTENAVAKDNSTGKIADAFSQIAMTSNRIRKGELVELIPDKGKTLFGMCITFGDMQFVNSPWYLENFIKHRMSLETNKINQWPWPLTNSPQALSISCLEDFVIVVRELGLLPTELFESKFAEPYERIGDWPAFLNQYRKEIHSWGLDVLRKTATDFFDINF